MEAQQRLDLAGDCSVDDGGDGGGDIGIGDHRLVERDDAVALGDPVLRGDLFEQRIGGEGAARQDAERHHRADDVAERRTEQRGDERAAADDGECDRIEELGDHARI